MTTIVIGQNEAARTPPGSDLKIAVPGLIETVAAILHGPNGTTVVHIDTLTDINFLVTELEVLGEGSTISLFKKREALGELDIKITRRLQEKGVTTTLVELPTAHPRIPFATAMFAAEGKREESTLPIAIALASGGTLEGKIDYGIEEFQTRIYTQQILGFLNPQLQISPTIIFDNQMWQKGARLSENELKLLNYLLGIKDGALPERIELSTVKERVLKILKSTSPAYKARFANEALWYDRGSLTVRLNYDHNFPELLMRIYAFMKKKECSFEFPDETPPTRKSAPKSATLRV